MEGLNAGDQTQLRQLLDEAACRRLVECYAYAVDWMNWPGLEALFWPDACFDFGMWAGDRAGFIPWVTELEEGYSRRLHMLASPRLEIGAETGRGEAGATTVVRSIDADGIGQDDVIFGRYQFAFARRDGAWRMSALRFLMHGMHRVPAGDNGGAPFFADGLDRSHPLFAQ